MDSLSSTGSMPVGGSECQTFSRKGLGSDARRRLIQSGPETKPLSQGGNLKESEIGTRWNFEGVMTPRRVTASLTNRSPEEDGPARAAMAAPAAKRLQLTT